MQEFALFAVLLMERPYKNPYIADGPRQELVEQPSRGLYDEGPSYWFDPAGIAKPGSLPGSAASRVAHVQAHKVASVGQPQAISPQKSR
jgi:hypothetical protein